MDISYVIIDKIWLSTKNITTNQLFKKLDHKMLRFFEAIGNKEIFIKLQPSQSMKIHHIFYPILLHKALIDLLTN